VFLRALKRCVLYFIRVFGLELLFLTREGSALLEDGWFRSRKEGKSVDKNGEPIPWMSYPLIDFIKPRLKKTFDIFEYGCGNSTLFFAHYVRSVTSVEHDENWVKSIAKRAPENVTLLIRPLEYGGDYCKSCTGQNMQYDIIVIDGRDRVNCVKQVLSQNKLKEDGVIIFDNSDRTGYREAYSQLLDSGYKRIDFFGIGPIVQIKTCTSIFYKANNIFSI